MKKENPWIVHVKMWIKKYPNKPLKEILKLAKSNYTKMKK